MIMPGKFNNEVEERKQQQRQKMFIVYMQTDTHSLTHSTKKEYIYVTLYATASVSTMLLHLI